LFVRSLIQRRQGFDDLHGFQTDAHNALEEVEDVVGLVVLSAPVVGVVADAAVFVHGDTSFLGRAKIGKDGIGDGGTAAIAIDQFPFMLPANERSMPTSPTLPLRGHSFHIQTLEKRSE